MHMKFNSINLLHCFFSIHPHQLMKVRGMKGPLERNMSPVLHLIMTQTVKVKTQSVVHLMHQLHVKYM